MTGMDEAKKIAQILDSKKAEELHVLKVDGVTALADYFVIATGMSNTHVKSLADEVQYQMEKLGIESRLEGKATDWMLLDFGNILVHIFTAAAREHYDLDKLWGDAETVSLDDLLPN